MKAKALTMVLTITMVCGLSSLLVERGAAASTLTQETPGPVHAIHIERTWAATHDNSQYAVSETSMGTVIGTHTILTHNHFHRPAEAVDEIVTIMGADGQVTELAMAEAIFERIDEGTLLIHLSGSVSLSPAPLADSQVVDGLSVGDWLTVSYWADDVSQFVQEDFEIVKIEAGVATLLDEHQHINSGDSGGGVYLEGQLVGNVWSIYTTPSGAPLGKFNVALLTPQVAALADWSDQSGDAGELEDGRVITQQ